MEVDLKQELRSDPPLPREVLAREFDAAFYACRYPDVTGDLLGHFMTEGWREHKDPAPWFSTSHYLETYADVAAAGLNPFYHYIEHGRGEGRAIAPAGTPPSSQAWEVEAVRRGIDHAFYAEQLRRLGVEPERIDVALHYWREGAALGLDPAPKFSTTFYLAAHADVAADGVNPFAHYLEQGRGEGRSVRDADVAEAPPSIASPSGTDDRALTAPVFDAEYYLAAYPDIAAAGVDPLDHFLGTGWREGRNPNLWFSVADYLDFYPDVASAGVNPLLHYLIAGKTENRAPRHQLGFRYDVIKSLQPLDERIAHARRSAPRRKASVNETLANALRRASGLETQGLYLSVSHDDFSENVGGVQLVLMRESAAVDAMGYDHLHLFPATPLPVAELEQQDPLVGVLLNRKRLGFFPASTIARELKRIAPRIRTAPFVIHSLIGHSGPALLSILQSAGCASGWYWVHDYSSVCSGYTLLRNDVQFCGGPPPSSTACSICVYGALRIAQMEAHELLFDALDLTVLAPSQAALDVWKASTSLSAPAKVHEHLRIAANGAKRQVRKPSSDRPLRIAYVGQPVVHKGWPVFKELAVSFGTDPRYDFFHVGKDPQPGVPATFREVAVSFSDPDAMVRALEELEVDVALIWSLWPETFCIAAVEALRSGAAVLTFKDSGNVAAMVRATGFGSVLDSEEQLARMFESGDIIELAAARRPSGVSAQFSNMTADFIAGGGPK